MHHDSPRTAPEKGVIVQHDHGGWISGGCDPVRPIPPGSTPLRELVSAIAHALALPTAATIRDELTYLRIYRDRARLVLLACRKILADREIEDDGGRDLMAVIASLRDQVAQIPDDSYDHHPEPTI